MLKISCCFHVQIVHCSVSPWVDNVIQLQFCLPPPSIKKNRSWGFLRNEFMDRVKLWWSTYLDGRLHSVPVSPLRPFWKEMFWRFARTVQWAVCSELLKSAWEEGPCMLQCLLPISPLPQHLFVEITAYAYFSVRSPKSTTTSMRCSLHCLFHF